MGSKTPPLPYWQMNVPSASRPTSCPDFLQNLSSKDTDILSTPDSIYRDLSWSEVRQLVSTNRLDAFQRRPSDLRRYLEYNYGSKQTHGSVMAFILKERVHWSEPVIAAGKPFEVESDLCVKYNDWGYGIDPKVIHLVVWTKFVLEEDPDTGDLTDAARGEIQIWVDRTFGSRMKKENVVWFKNWMALKSVHVLEHFHVMMYDPDPAFISEITGGHIPASGTN